MKIEYTSSELDKIMDYESELQTWLETLRILKESLIEFGLELVEESVSWKINKTRVGGTEYEFKQLDDLIYVGGTDEDTPKTERIFLTTNHEKQKITLVPYVAGKGGLGSSRCAPNNLSPEFLRGWSDFINRDIKDFVVLYDNRAKVYLYLEVCNTNNRFYQYEKMGSASSDLYRQRKYDCSYELWYDLMYEYDKTKLYEQQKYGASVSQVIPEVAGGIDNLTKYLGNPEFQTSDYFTGRLVHERKRCFMRPPVSGDNILITYNKGYFSMCFYNNRRMFHLNKPHFIYARKLNYVEDSKSYVVATNNFIAVAENGQPDKRFRFFYMLRNDWKHFCYYHWFLIVSYIMFNRFVIKNRMDMSFILQDEYNLDDFFDDNGTKVSYPKLYAIDGIPKYNYIAEYSIGEAYTRHRFDNTMLSSLDNTVVKFPLIFYVTRQPQNTNTLSGIIEVDSVNLINDSGRQDGDVVIERDGENITKSIFVNRWMGKTSTIIMLEYYKKLELLKSVDHDIINLNGRILDFDKIIIKTNTGIVNTINVEKLEESFMDKSPVNLTGDSNLVYNIIIDTDRTLKLKDRGDVEITSIVGIRG
jgi:hypothetical protein|nr:MAG TPA: hypothetical protein [Caudoviricetes sp.]